MQGNYFKMFRKVKKNFKNLLKSKFLIADIEGDSFEYEIIESAVKKLSNPNFSALIAKASLTSAEGRKGVNSPSLNALYSLLDTLEKANC